jgi:alkylation response protein AidB-like acyl-CoA dehydrogenase
VSDQSLRDQIQDERWTAHRREHAQDRTTVEATRREMERRLDEMNMLRRQIDAERGNYLSRDEYVAAHNALTQMVQRVQQTVWMGMGGVMAVVTLVGILVSLWGRHG